MISIRKLNMIYNAMRNVLSVKFTNSQKPIQVSFAVTNKCNLKCIYCYGNYGYREEDDLALDELKFAFRYLKKLGAFQIFLTGGEPLLRPDLNEIVGYLKNLGFSIGIVTNSTLVPYKIDILKKVDHVILSVDGDKDANDMNRGKGTFDKVLKSIEILEKNKIAFSFKAVFNKNNFNQLDYLVTLAEKYNSTLETIIPYENFGDKSQYLTSEQKKILLERILEYVKEKRGIKFSNSAHKMSTDVFLQYNQSIIYDEKPSKYPECIAGKLYLFIDANGDVYPCNQLIRQFKPLNIRKDGIRKAVRHTLNRNCTMCCIPFLNEKKYLFSFSPKVIWYRFFK